MIVRFTKRITSACIFALMFLFIPAILQITIENTKQFVLENQPRSNFFTYEKVIPIKDTFEVNEVIKMESYSNVYQPLNFIWNDVLRCDFDNDGYTLVNVGSLTNRANHIEIGENKISRWEFTSPLPSSPANCFIESNITAEVGYSVIKEQKIISGGFRIE